MLLNAIYTRLIVIFPMFVVLLSNAIAIVTASGRTSDKDALAAGLFSSEQTQSVRLALLRERAIVQFKRQTREIAMLMACVTAAVLVVALISGTVFLGPLLFLGGLPAYTVLFLSVEVIAVIYLAARYVGIRRRVMRTP